MRRAVEMWIEFILIGVMGLDILFAVGILPGELDANKVFIRIRYLGCDIADEDLSSVVVVNRNHDKS